jgi:hypothetical protein
MKINKKKQKLVENPDFDKKKKFNASGFLFI